MAGLFNKIIKSCIYLLAFFVPIFWLPFSFETFELNKQYLLFFLVSLAFFCWLARMVLIDKEIRFQRTPLDIFVLVFLFLAIFSAIFSIDKISSLFGFYGRFSDGLIGLLSLGVLYFLITNNAEIKLKTQNSKVKTTNQNSKVEEKNNLHPLSVQGILKTFLGSVFFVILISYLSIFGIWAKINGLITQWANWQLPVVMLQRIFNPISGSLEGLAIFLAVVIVLLVGLLLVKNEKEKVESIFSWILLIPALGLLLIIDFTSAWIVLLVTLTLVVGFSLVRRIFRENINRLLLPISLIIIAAVSMSINTSGIISGALKMEPLLREQVLDQRTSWRVAIGAVTDNVKSGFLGSGIGTFYYDFAKFKSVEFNESPPWAIRFDRSGNYFSELLATMGFLGLLAYLGLIGMFLLISWLIISLNRRIPVLMVFLALLVAQFVYYQNTVLAFTFWLILGLSASSWQKPDREKTFSLKDFPELSLILNVLLILFTLAILTFYFFAIRFYLADVNYLKSFIPVSAQEREEKLEKAISLNPYLPNYRIVLSRNYLNQIITEIQKAPELQDPNKIQNWVAEAISQARKATEISPNNVAAQEALAMIYRDIQLLVAGALEWAIKFFESAIKLEPTNPVFFTELGKLYLATDLSKAREYFAKAKDLKPDYLDALIQEVLIYERENDLDAAIRKMEELVNNHPFNIEARFQLGRFYFNKDRVDEAISQFETIILIFPNHSDSLYSLGAAYTRKGEKEKAISAFEKVLELNPGNQNVIQRIEELKK